MSDGSENPHPDDPDDQKTAYLSWLALGIVFLVISFGTGVIAFVGVGVAFLGIGIGGWVVARRGSGGSD